MLTDYFDKKRDWNKRYLFYLLLTGIFILTALIYESWIKKTSDPVFIAERFRHDLLRADDMLRSRIDSLASPSYHENILQADSIIRTADDQGFAFFFFIYRNDSLEYWSDNSAPMPPRHDPSFKNGMAIVLPNGFYLYRDTLVQEVRIAGLILIKRNYPYQNDYLENRFQKGFRLPGNTGISFAEGPYPVYDHQGQFLFSISPPAGHIPGKLPAYILLLIYALAFLSLNAFLYHVYLLFKPFFRAELLLVIAYSLDVIFLRVLMFFLKLPASLYNSHLFEPGSFAASDYFPSMGDFLFNALALLSIAYVLFLSFRHAESRKKHTPAGRYFLIFSLFLHVFIFYRLFLWAAESLVIDASYSLNLNQIFFLSAESFLALGVFAILLFSFFLISFRLLGLAFYYSCRKISTYFALLLIATLVYYLTCRLVHDCSFPLFIPLFIYAITFFFLSYPRSRIDETSFSNVLVYLFLFAIISTAILSTYNNKKETGQRMLLSIELAGGEDPLTEYIFRTMTDEMRQDTLLLKLLSQAPYSIDNEDWAVEYIEEAYLSDRLRKYEYMVTICTPERSLIIQPEGYIMNCNEYFGDIISNVEKSTPTDDLYRYSNDAGLCNYLSKQTYVLNDGRDTVNLYLELFSFFFPEEGLGYPELLIDENVQTFSGIENYSYARYINGKLVFKYGDYPYSTNFERYADEEAGTFFDHNNFAHYISRIDADEYLIISREEESLIEIVAPFSYLLLFFTFFILIFLFMVSFPFTRLHLGLNFRNRLQLYIIALIIISFIFVGYISVSYIINLNSTKNDQILREKTHSVLIELEHKLSGAEHITPDMEDYLSNLLIKFSQVFFSDINLYDLRGRLLASSRPEIFQKKLISARMNAEAYRTLTIDKKLLFIHTETIGDQEYSSAYVPFMNARNEVVAYLNLPYFARQTELQTEISYFLNAFLNAYVLLIAVAIFIALLISRFTTRPLQLIREKIRNLSLGGVNEKIKWSRNDEIGTLVAEYNRMVDELEKSALLLARSERESAWREMAKQVAHEIKNPLTPMKLSVQYLQKAWDENSPDWDERLRKFTNTIIEHIDTLSAIASEFSDFAKMPQKNEEMIDLSEVIGKSLHLFSDIENITFSFRYEAHAPAMVMADKNQLIRVFNNLIQNSVQAIGPESRGMISISLHLEKDQYVIRVEDDGPGIPVDMVDKIFSPSFTTKSSGMGLGLALVRSIVQDAGGSVDFESRPGSGTVFIVRLPATGP
jgi:signal transduction histidine kinase